MECKELMVIDSYFLGWDQKAPYSHFLHLPFVKHASNRDQACVADNGMKY